MELNGIIILGLAAGTCATISFLPQVIKIIKTKETRDVSLWMYVLFTAGVLMWLIYGILIRDFPLTLANAVTLALAGTVLVLKIKHG